MNEVFKRDQCDREMLYKMESGASIKKDNQRVRAAAILVRSLQRRKQWEWRGRGI